MSDVKKLLETLKADLVEEPRNRDLYAAYEGVVDNIVDAVVSTMVRGVDDILQQVHDKAEIFHKDEEIANDVLTRVMGRLPDAINRVLRGRGK
jgi:hypothetical protein